MGWSFLNSTLSWKLPRARSAPRREALVPCYDQRGHKRLIPREEWRTDVLPRQIARAGDRHDRLRGIVETALAHHCAVDVLHVAERLLALDPDRGAAQVLHARTLVAAGRADAAEQELVDRLAAGGPDAAALTALARVHEARGDKTRAAEVLWQALSTDPNHAEAVEWYATLRPDDGLARIAALPGAWRAALGGARAQLDAGRTAEALAAYRGALADPRLTPPALRQAAEDLVRRGQHAAVLDLVQPLYDAQRDDARTGLAILQACTAARDLDIGRPLLHQLFLRHRHELRNHLQTQANRFLALLDRPADEIAAASDATDASGLRVAAIADQPMLVLDRPVWWSFLRAPEWLRPQRRVGVPVIAFATWAGEADDGRSGWSRAIPLVLAETFAFRCAAESVALLPLAEDGTAQALSGPWSDDQAFELANRDERFADYVVTGELAADGARCELSLTVYDAARRLKLGVATRRGATAAVGMMLADLAQEISALVGAELCDDPLGVYRATHPRLVADDLAAHDGLLRLHLAQDAGTTPPLLERGAVLDACERLATAGEATSLHRLLFIAAAAADAGFGCQLYRERIDAALALIDAERELDSTFVRAAPLLLWLFDQQREFRALRDALLAKANDPVYRDWLERVGQDAAEIVVIGDDL